MHLKRFYMLPKCARMSSGSYHSGAFDRDPAASVLPCCNLKSCIVLNKPQILEKRLWNLNLQKPASGWRSAPPQAPETSEEIIINNLNTNQRAGAVFVLYTVCF